MITQTPYNIIENSTEKRLISSDVNYYFNKQNGFTATWGKTVNDDAAYSPFGPFIADIEISNICHRGSEHGKCLFCYKSNTLNGKNMSLSTFKQLFSKLPRTITQIALGIGSIDSNEHLFNIMEHCRSNDVVPNITINGERMTPKYYDLLYSLCGACAISLYDKDTCYNAVQELTNRGMSQCNVHALLSEETFYSCMRILYDMGKDKRLDKLNAVVFLALKSKGVRNTYHKVSKEQFETLVLYAISNQKRFGFDSCTAHNFLDALKKYPCISNYKQMEMMVEPCESGLFSLYSDVDGAAFPCSFSPDIGEWKEGIDVLNCNDFIKDVWNHPKMEKYRQLSLKNNRKCLLYDMELK